MARRKLPVRNNNEAWGRLLNKGKKIDRPDSSYFEAIEMGGVLEKARKLVDGRDKQEHYGPPEEFMGRLAEAWTAYLRSKLKADITPFDAAMMMANLKILRLGSNPKHEDSLIDLGGYVRIGERTR